MQGPRRFTDLEHSVPGIGGRMLSERLKDLEAHGILERMNNSEGGVRMEYGLTAKGYGLREVIASIQQWADAWEQLAPGPAQEDTVPSVR